MWKALEMDVEATGDRCEQGRGRCVGSGDRCEHLPVLKWRASDGDVGKLGG